MKTFSIGFDSRRLRRAAVRARGRRALRHRAPRATASSRTRSSCCRSSSGTTASRSPTTRRSPASTSRAHAARRHGGAERRRRRRDLRRLPRATSHNAIAARLDWIPARARASCGAGSRVSIGTTACHEQQSLAASRRLLTAAGCRSTSATPRGCRVFADGERETLYTAEFRRDRRHARRPRRASRDAYLASDARTHVVDALLDVDVQSYLPGDLLVEDGHREHGALARGPLAAPRSRVHGDGGKSAGVGEDRPTQLQAAPQGRRPALAPGPHPRPSEARLRRTTRRLAARGAAPTSRDSAAGPPSARSRDVQAVCGRKADQRPPRQEGGQLEPDLGPRSARALVPDVHRRGGHDGPVEAAPSSAAVVDVT